MEKNVVINVAGLQKVYNRQKAFNVFKKSDSYFYEIVFLGEDFWV
jgi:hypothetical protein